MPDMYTGGCSFKWFLQNSEKLDIRSHPLDAVPLRLYFRFDVFGTQHTDPYGKHLFLRLYKTAYAVMGAFSQKYPFVFIRR